ncbi:MAG: hypothetical protein RJQ07_09200 [Pseudomonadales bacterium]
MEKETEEKYQLIDSFVYLVGQYLPESQRADISADLRQSIYEEIESMVEQTGEPVSEADLLAVIGRFGHPLKVANSYLPQRYLIGPDMFPIYTRLLRTFVTLAVVGLVGFGLLMSFVGDWQMGAWQLLGTGLEILMWLVFSITAVCIAIEFGGEKLKWYERWNPADIARNAVGPIDRSDVFTNLLSEGFFLLWWNDVFDFGEFITLSPVWQPYDLALNLIFGLSFVLHAYILVIGHWRRFAMIAEVVLFSATVGLGLVLITGDPLVVVSSELAEAGAAGFIDKIIRSIVIAIVLFTLWDIYKGLKMWRGGYDAGIGVAK